jgi:hypothetical protein
MGLHEIKAHKFTRSYILRRADDIYHRRHGKLYKKKIRETSPWTRGLLNQREKKGEEIMNILRSVYIS